MFYLARRTARARAKKKTETKTKIVWPCAKLRILKCKRKFSFWPQELCCVVVAKDLIWVIFVSGKQIVDLFTMYLHADNYADSDWACKWTLVSRKQFQIKVNQLRAQSQSVM